MSVIEKIEHILNVLNWKINSAFRRPRYNSKVFCIGFQKTGTTTVGKSLELLGLRNATYSNKIYLDYYKNGKIDEILSYTAKFDSVDDLPWSKEKMIPILYEKFPGSKFIYLERDVESWKSSYKKWHLKHLGYPAPNLERKVQEFVNHKEFVYGFFRDKPSEQFLSLDVRDDDGFLKLAKFVGKITNRNKLPHYNKT